MRKKGIACTSPRSEGRHGLERERRSATTTIDDRKRVATRARRDRGSGAGERPVDASRPQAAGAGVHDGTVLGDRSGMVTTPSGCRADSIVMEDHPPGSRRGRFDPRGQGVDSVADAAVGLDRQDDFAADAASGSTGRTTSPPMPPSGSTGIGAAEPAFANATDATTARVVTATASAMRTARRSMRLEFMGFLVAVSRTSRANGPFSRSTTTATTGFPVRWHVGQSEVCRRCRPRRPSRANGRHSAPSALPLELSRRSAGA